MGILRAAALLTIGRAKHISSGLCLFPNLVRVLKAPRARDEAFQFVTVGYDDEHLIDEVMGQYAMGLIQSGPFSPRFALQIILRRFAVAHAIAELAPGGIHDIAERN